MNSMLFEDGLSPYLLPLPATITNLSPADLSSIHFFHLFQSISGPGTQICSTMCYHILLAVLAALKSHSSTTTCDILIENKLPSHLT